MIWICSSIGNRWKPCPEEKGIKTFSFHKISPVIIVGNLALKKKGLRPNIHNNNHTPKTLETLP